MCCGPFLRGDADPQTAEELMRSRYCAFVVCDDAYLLSTWHASTRPRRIRFDPMQRWLGLQIRATQDGGPDDLTGVVEFVCRSKINGKGHRLHEVSRFARVEGRWRYLDGKHL